MKICFHLGYPKTGSTFLQTHVFPKHREINFLGSKNYFNWKDVKITQNDLDLFKDNYFLKNKDKDVINDKFKHFSNEKINVISSERYTDFKNVINNFYDCKFIQDYFDKKNIEVSFLIVLRNQYDLIKSYYNYNFSIIYNFLNISNFNKLISYIDFGKEKKINQFSLKLFLEQFDFNILNKKLSTSFKNCKIDYLFYEDLKFNKNIFNNNFCDVLKLDKIYTKDLFMNSAVISEKRTTKEYNPIINPTMYKIVNSKIYIALRDKLTLIDYMKKFYFKFFLYQKNIQIKDEEKLKNIVKEYYKVSNQVFFKTTNIINKYNY